MPRTANTHPNRNQVSKKKMATAANIAQSTNFDYSGLLSGVQNSFGAALSLKAPWHNAIFQTDAKDLNKLYLDALPSERQHHNCHACRHFLERFGGLVTTDENGILTPVMWSARVPDFYITTFQALRQHVSRARITGVFYSKDRILGTPVTGDWSHMAAELPPELVYRERALTVAQAMAAKKEDYKNVSIALAEFQPEALDEALRVLNANALSRSEKYIAPVRWLRDLHNRPKGRTGENILWLAIATAPPGFCHPRSSSVGSLLEDIIAGLTFSAVKSRWDYKRNPLTDQRPQAAPTAGNIKAAEALVDKLGIATSLERRFATMDDIQQFIWRPRSALAQPTPSGIFGHLKPKNSNDIEPLQLPAQTITWEKFARTILPTTSNLSTESKIQFRVPSSGAFIALTAAAHADAPPILKWDSEDERNTVAWYLHHPYGIAPDWNLTPNTWVEVTAIIPFPTMWGAKPMPEIADGAIILLSGARDVRERTGGSALFPETLKSELHSARATIEAYSRSAKLSGTENSNACGYDLRKENAICTLRVNNTVYSIDRWD